MPHKSPAQEMGNAAFAVRSPPSAAKTVSSPEEINAFLRRISSSNCLETGLSSKSFFGIPAVAMMRSRSHTAVPMPLAAEMHSAMFLALSFSSPTGEYLRKMMLPSLSMKISSGVPSLIFMVRRSSFGTTTRPRSSIRLTIPVAFISQISLVFKVSVWVVFEKCGELYTLQSFTEIHSGASGICFDVKSGMVEKDCFLCCYIKSSVMLE